MDLDKIARRILGLPTKEDKLRAKGVKLIEQLQTKATMATKIEFLAMKMTEEINPRLVSNIHDLEAVGMLEEIISQFEEIVVYESNVKNILEPLYDIQAYAHEQNGIEV